MTPTPPTNESNSIKQEPTDNSQLPSTVALPKIKTERFRMHYCFDCARYFSDEDIDCNYHKEVNSCGHKEMHVYYQANKEDEREESVHALLDYYSAKLDFIYEHLGENKSIDAIKHLMEQIREARR